MTLRSDDIDFAELDRIFDSILEEFPLDQQTERPVPSANLYYDSIGACPQYVPHSLNRGAKEDTYYVNPLYRSMVNNLQVLHITSYGTDQDVLSLPNLSNQTPGTKPKCDQALENKLFIDATCYLILNCGITNVASVYRRLAVLSDRLCLGCSKPSYKTVCLCGKFRCHHCVHKGRDVDFQGGFTQWLQAGCPSRHATVINAS